MKSLLLTLDMFCWAVGLRNLVLLDLVGNPLQHHLPAWLLAGRAQHLQTLLSIGGLNGPAVSISTNMLPPLSCPRLVASLFDRGLLESKWMPRKEEAGGRRR